VFEPLYPHNLHLATTTTPQSVQWIVRGHPLLAVRPGFAPNRFLDP
jgi:hypothetical protein